MKCKKGIAAILFLCGTIFFTAKLASADPTDNTTCQVKSEGWEQDDFHSLPRKIVQGFNRPQYRFCTEWVFMKKDDGSAMNIVATGQLNINNAEDTDCSNTSHVLCGDGVAFKLDGSTNPGGVTIDVTGLPDQHCAINVTGNHQVHTGYKIKTNLSKKVGTAAEPDAVICDNGSDNNFDGVEIVAVGGSCGNGTKEGTEECDDGNQDNGDGCSSACTDTDRDDDGKDDSTDNCPPPVGDFDISNYKNPDQADCDDDHIGNVCDNDWDNDTVPDGMDNCKPDHAVCNKDELLKSSNPPGSGGVQSNLDGDEKGDICDDDRDGDGIKDDGDASGTVGDHKCTGGDHENCDDNCVNVANPTQEDIDSDGVGKDCDPDETGADSDGDGVADGIDNCPTIKNGPAEAAIVGVGNQTDNDSDTLGDACDPDDDNDGVSDEAEALLCTSPVPLDPTKADSDGDGSIDGLDTCPCDPSPTCGVVNPPVDDDKDDDGVVNLNDNCPSNANPGQEDGDGDAIGDACDPDNPTGDADTDGVANGQDNCSSVANPDQANEDGDSMGDACDPNPSVNDDTPTGATGGGCALHALSGVALNGWTLLVAALAGIGLLRRRRS